MKFTRTLIPDVIICEPNAFGDDRGYFVETFREDKLEEFLGFTINFCQDNESKSSYGVLRGLHYQLPPFSQTKLVRVLTGRVLDVAVDIRKGSKTFGKHVSVELTGENKKQLLVPRGFAHGFLVLSEEATFAYKVDNYYSPECDRGFAFDDTSLNIDWKLPVEKILLSPKDMQQPLFKDAAHFEDLISLYE
ncbi:dTDP-4-dehydrorhamnose 3,5-epimerase [Polaribacter sp.]|jgi:dTDP-4-dehydrorhamnose 3,5-epimerase|uniref:dTDP-4-dehydrorhamnose 3,5-epimerase n=1 Tax=Polaribacter sp. TaxID=1920175 RepID=UPI003AD6342B